MRREGVGQDELAKRLGCSRPYVTRLLGGHQIPSDVMRFKIERVTDGEMRWEDWRSFVAKKLVSDNRLPANLLRDAVTVAPNRAPANGVAS